jgi:hypothetical protein
MLRTLAALELPGGLSAFELMVERALCLPGGGTALELSGVWGAFEALRVDLPTTAGAAALGAIAKEK